jgi:hypothetical protein
VLTPDKSTLPSAVLQSELLSTKEQCSSLVLPLDAQRPKLAKPDSRYPQEYSWSYRVLVSLLNSQRSQLFIASLGRSHFSTAKAMKSLWASRTAGGILRR